MNHKKNGELENYKHIIKDEIQHLLNNNLFDEAKTLISEYENIIKNDIDIFQAKAIIYLHEGKYNLAFKILKKAIQIDPNNCDTYFNLGYLFEIQTKYKEAYDYYQIAKEVSTDRDLNLQINEIQKLLLEKMEMPRLKQVLIIAHIFPPVGGSGVQRTLKFVKYLRNFGWEPIVVTVGKTNYPLIDTTLENEIPDGLRIIRIDEDYKINSEIINEIYTLFEYMKIDNGLLDTFKEKIVENINYIQTPDVFILWANNVLKQIHDYIDISEIDLIYTTSGPYSDHIIGYHLKQQFQKPWVADFRDEWTNNPYYSPDKKDWFYKINYELEEKVVHAADKIITVTPKTAENYKRIFKVNHNKVITITNGYDEEDFTHIDISNHRRNDKFTIIHNGLFYSIRNPITFLKALNNLIKKNLIDRSKVKVQFSWSENYQEWIHYINEFQLENIVEFFGYISHQESLKLATNANLLLLIVGPGEKNKATYPGKLFEYLRLGKPILSLSPVGSEVENLIKEFNRGYNVDFNDIDNIEKCLLIEYNKWLTGDSSIKNVNNTRQFERKNLTKKLSEVLNSLVPEQNNFSSKPKIAFFSIKNGDKFLGDIINNLTTEYKIRKIIVRDLNQIDEGMEWADICWFEWCDQLIAYGSNHALAKEKKLICRIHRYEVFTDNALNVQWENVDKLIVVTEHLQNILEESIPDIGKRVSIHVVENGVDLTKFNFKEKKDGYNLAFIGDMNYRKNPFFMLQILKKLVEINPQYKLYIAGVFTDQLIERYWNYQIKELGLEKNIIFEGWQNDINKWLADKNYILAPTIHESFGYFIAEAMACGIKPIIHNFLYAKEIWPQEYLFNTIDEAVEMVLDKNYDSKKYREFIELNYSLDKQINKINILLNSMLNTEKGIYQKSGNIDNKTTIAQKSENFDYEQYWNKRLNQNFNLIGVGNIDFGEIYNIYLYKSRIDILKYLINTLFGNLKDKRILEIGPGIGVFTDFFKKEGVGTYLGIDISEKATKFLAEKYKDFLFVNDDISNYDHPLHSFDLIFAADVLLHITDEKKYVKALKNLCSQLDDNGYMIFFDQISLKPEISSVPHVVIRDIDYIKKLLDREGFEVVDVLPTTFFMNSPFDKSTLMNFEKVRDIFSLLLYCFKNNLLDAQKQHLFGEYLFFTDKLCLNKFKIGPSQKAIIIRKRGNTNNIKLDIEAIWDKDYCEEKIREIKNSKEFGELLVSNKINEVINLINQILNGVN